MSIAESDKPKIGDPSPAEPPWWRRPVVVRRIAVTVWLIAMLLFLTVVGVSFDRNTIVVMMCLGLAAMCIGRRKIITVILDWIPFVAVLALYDLARHLASWVGRPTQWTLAPDVDHAIFGVNPTVWLQEHLKHAQPPWWEVITSVVYISFFILPYVTAGVLWLKDRATWRKYAVRFVAISFVALAGYIFVPAAPPWAAANCTAAEVASHPKSPSCMFRQDGPVGQGLLGHYTSMNPPAHAWVERISNRGWDVLHIHVASNLVSTGQSSSNLVAAIPSLHAGLTMLLALFMWNRTRALGKTLFMGYALAMAFTLVYTGEHYVFDILLGWASAAAVMGAFWMIDRARETRRITRGSPQLDAPVAT